MSEYVIRAEGLSKRYRIGARQGRYPTLRDSLTSAVAAQFRAAKSGFKRNGTQSAGGDHIWAIRDVSFSIRPGEVIGVVGRNGSGKSTLLKLLSRITEPTIGWAEIYGRVGSLLEVGTGFHPELTGRENIFLNGAILGMRRREIERQFDEIVEFAEVAKFIDTPVKHYSSGMYLRLAFGVAAHLDPEILLVDEVLAVGDAEFQKKCLRKIKEVGRGGRTILLVSHNMAAIRAICDRTIIMSEGQVLDDGPTDYAVDRYLATLNSRDDTLCPANTESFRVNEVRIISKTGPVIKTFDPVEMTIRFTPRVPIMDPGLYVGILAGDGQRVTALDFKDFKTVPSLDSGEESVLGFHIDEFPLLPGGYQLQVYMKDMSSRKIEEVPRTYPFEVVESPIYGGREIDRWYGYIGLHAHALQFEDSQERQNEQDQIGIPVNDKTL